ncbi:uncharacterized protein LOC124915060 [Impatiens glandulifera]|uniref:uncharacterized protein LOC124915060 n=1 Tax=Impatiens glandulifera TaxID=253017 RepID=UPI001FB09E6E|nr:uncharacterized protein LOC124915060 [Impatiens glandulifera]XP_047311664.1 uncharacterized protein LOC124915060 [Impatiens glandulifera]
MGLPLINLVRFKGIPILKQLHLEEQLLRTSSHNWCIINDGTNSPTVVMGLSGKVRELVDIENVVRDHIPVIRRFTGGGTVIVDDGTLFVSLICNRDDFPSVQPYPRTIMEWSSLIYSDVFQGTADFQLRENDYVFGKHKIGGNAQSITRKRWIHHTSFLWDYEARNMGYLKLPARAPQYREARSHTEFICKMKEYMSRSDFICKTIEALENQFIVSPTDLDIDSTIQNTDYTHSTKLLSKTELEEAQA